MNVLILKIIALSTMIIDHYGAIFHSGTEIYRIIGRLSFPIYCFLLVEGYFHTSNVKKYALRLLIFAFISEIPFDLAFFNEVGFIHQNIFFTLFLGLMTIYIIDNKSINLKYVKYAIIPISCILAIILAVDYNIIGIIYILSFYYTKKYTKLKRFSVIGLIMAVTNFGAYILQQFSLLALPIVYFHNGKLGPKNKFLQVSFYAAYPLHLLLFYVIKSRFLF
ncbi:TraX family protein [Sedimentibacter sp.]|uniref:TraX family protein n=1 Tax=Sedimentibacter sp. TaxID=1960295 RepID=UPI0028ACE0FC|nr:TraX family protein [Sedimentibacter sp.]